MPAKRRRTASRLFLAALGMALALGTSADAAEALRFDFTPRRVERRAAPKTLVAPLVDKPPRIDGRPTEAAWRAAGKLVLRDDRRGPAKLRVFVCHDRKNLYVAARCVGAVTRARKLPRDKDPYNDDCVEVWIASPPGRRAEMYHFIVNAANAVLDMMGHRRGYDAAWSSATFQGKRGWDVEMAIPLAAVGLDRWPKYLAFNIGRNGPSFAPYAWAAWGVADGSRLEMQGGTAPAALAAEEDETGTGSRDITCEGALRLDMDRNRARPGERFLEMNFALVMDEARLRGARLTAALYDLEDMRRLATTEVVPTGTAGRLFVDLRSVNRDRALLRVELRAAGRKGLLGAASALVRAAPPAVAMRNGDRFDVRIDVPKGAGEVKAWPVTFGAPFPAGALWDVSRVRVVDGRGRAVPFQTEVTGRWAPEGAIQWLRVDALVDSGRGCAVVLGPPAKPAAPAKPLTLERRGDAVVMDTGVARYALGPGPSPVREVFRNGRRVVRAQGARGLYVVDQRGRLGRAASQGETVTVEARGPVAGCVRFEGDYRDASGRRMARHITRVECFAGQPFARIVHTLVLTENTNEVWFREVGWELAVEPGENVNALFGADRADASKIVSQPLSAARPEAFMLQDRHFAFAHGKSHFSVNAADSRGKARARHEGEECGDWAAALGARGGALIGCREAARQHPKEFVVGRGLVNLKLFSDRAGEQLDFRPPALVKKWDLANWRPGLSPKSKKALVETVGKIKTNAVGWAKTHELLLSPLAPGEDPKALARLARLRSTPVYAHVDPAWIYKSQVLGRLHPRDPKRFPQAEQVVDAVFDYAKTRVPAFGEYGFTDYFAGPHLSYIGDRPTRKRNKDTYCLHEAVWFQYARSADRSNLELAANCTRGYMDYYVSHHTADRKIRGLYHYQGSDNDWTSRLPFCWHGPAAFTNATTTHPSAYIRMYRMTGSRRALDVALEYADAVKKHLTPAQIKRQARPSQLLKAVVQLYQLNWDPELRKHVDAVGDHVYDPETSLHVTKEKPRGLYYKVTSDLPGLIDIWRTLGERRYFEMAFRCAEWRWYQSLAYNLYDYGYTMGYVGPFLYEHTGDPSIPQWLHERMLNAAATYDPTTGKFSNRHALCPAYNYFIMRDMGFVEDLVRRTNADKAELASWVAFDPFGESASVFVRKTSRESLRLWVGGLRQGVQWLNAKGVPLFVGARIDYLSGRHCLELFKDLDGGAYEARFPATTRSCALVATSSVPMVLRAPIYWRPFPPQRPRQRVYFRVPKPAKGARILFERRGLLFDPKGKPYRAGDKLTGWVDLPAERPGLWGFELPEGGLVKVRNAPPLFAFGDPKRYFDPGAPWEREEVDATPPPKRTDFVPGAVETPGNKALYVTLSRRFRVLAGPDLPSGDGSRFLPVRQGTIEFFFRPNWSTFSVTGRNVPLAVVETSGKPFVFRYDMTPKHKPEWHAYVLYSTFAYQTRHYRKYTVIEPRKWIHLAWVWHVEHGKTVARVFVNGKQGTHSVSGNRPPITAKPRALMLGWDAAFDELRVSDVPRYKEDFRPPSRERELRLDKHTRALFHFDGDLRGVSYGHEGSVPTRLGK